MIAVYVLFLYNIGAAVYIMKLGHSSKLKEATAINKKALKFLPILIIILVVMVVVI